jgi:hypothetical protein
MKTPKSPWADINAKSAAMNKKMGTKPAAVVVVTPAKRTPPPSLGKKIASAASGVKSSMQDAFQKVRTDAQNTRRKNIDDIVDGKKRK